jgi:C1A family cysteine protease
VKRGYGYIKDEPDERDHMMLAAPPSLVVPDAHDLTAAFCPVMDQGQYGSCTAHGVTAAIRYNLINSDRGDIPLSRSQLYWDSGALEGNTGDVGRQIRDVIATVAAKGTAREELWGYDKIGQQPTPDVYADAIKHEALEYQRVTVDRASINTAIFVGHPIVIGIPVFKAFESDEVAATGRVPMPAFGETEIGSHCMLMGGYDPAWDKIMNSWSETWGAAGYCFLPRGYLEKYGSDLWSVLMDN